MRKIIEYYKSHKLYLVYGIYVSVIWMMGNEVNDTFTFDLFKSTSIDISPMIISFLILVATTISLFADVKFHQDIYLIEREANSVEINELGLKKIRKRIKIIRCIGIKVAMLIPASCSYFIVDVASSDKWEYYTCFYACILVSVLIGLTLYGYIFFFVIIMCMKEVYEWDFRKYTYTYPLATTIFNRFNEICTYGLGRFWSIGAILIFLSLIIFDQKSFSVMLIIGGLILIGYIFFTFYPYYLARKKVSLLKLQTIRTMCFAKNMMETDNYNNYSEMIKNVSDSPNVLSTNFNLVLTSTAAAMTSLITSILAIWGSVK